MATVILRKNTNIILIDILLLGALYLVPSFSHVTNLPLYKFEPMRVALLAALLFTNRSNTYFIAFTIPLASALISGHPVPLKAVLMGVEFSVLVASYGYLMRLARIPATAALVAGIIMGKLVYYTLKFGSLSVGILDGQLISTPLQTQLILGLATASIFGLVAHFHTSRV